MAFIFETVSSKLLVDSPILALRRDEVTMPSGHTAYRDVVEHLGAVAVVAVNEKGEVALVYQYRHSVGRRLWELPAGLLDIKGESELVAAKRELQEEAGLEAKNWSVLCDLVTSPGFCEETVRVFLATDLAKVSRLEDSGDEEADMEFRWVPLADAVASILAGEINNSIAVAGLLAASRVIDKHETGRDVSVPFDLRPTSMAARRSGPDLKVLSKADG